MLDYPLKNEFFGSKSTLGYQMSRPQKLEKKEGDKFDNYRSGAIFIEGTPAIEGQVRKFDWTKRIKLALNRQEISDIAHLKIHRFLDTGTGAMKAFAPAELKLYHDTGKGTATEGQHVKSLTVRVSESTKSPGNWVFGFSFYEKENGAEKKVSVFLTEQQANLLQADFTLGLGVTSGAL